MSLTIEMLGLEEKQHPYYILRYAVKYNQQEIVNSVARYTHQEQGGRVQFLEPDLKKIHRLPNALTHLDQIEQSLKEEGQRQALKNSS